MEFIFVCFSFCAVFMYYLPMLSLEIEKRAIWSIWFMNSPHKTIVKMLSGAKVVFLLSFFQVNIMNHLLHLATPSERNHPSHLRSGLEM